MVRLAQAQAAARSWSSLCNALNAVLQDVYCSSPSVTYHKKQETEHEDDELLELHLQSLVLNVFSQSSETAGVRALFVAGALHFPSHDSSESVNTNSFSESVNAVSGGGTYVRTDKHGTIRGRSHVNLIMNQWCTTNDMIRA